MGKMLQKDFINKVSIKHNNLYNYSKTIYNGIFNKIIITCFIHGDFIQSANDHSNGNGCQKCSTKRGADKIRHTTNTFITKAILKHKDRYDYSLVNYHNNHTKIDIICKLHGIFKQIPSSHLLGYNCPQCNWSFNNRHKESWVAKGKGKLAMFYIIRCWNELEEFYKYGITFREIEERYKNKTSMPYNWELMKSITSGDLAFIWNLENAESLRVKNLYYKPLLKFNGCRYECFKK